MKMAIIRIRGIRKIKPKIKKTLELLRLGKPNYCTIVDDSKASMGMITVVNDYVAFGEIDGETLFRLIYKRGMRGSKHIREMYEKEKIMEMAKGIMDGKAKVSEVADPVFMLHPPRKGYKDTKRAYPRGDLGRRGDIGLLLRRMM
ncbi:50S ribosomal protein L30 [Candidatus Micrarchaeota archaeon]|nr:50S ribosomal protein L30 [Candidatus Micrarchaeota archaeon]